MLIQYHISITRKALEEKFNQQALEAILKANVKQDDLITGQIGHDEYHYDNNAIAKADAYLAEQRELTFAALQENDLPAAWIAFGRLIHTSQDFYAHSNYVDLWLSQFDGQTPPPPSEIAPVMKNLLQSSELRSGKLYYPLEILAFIPILKRFVIPRLPADSHAHMHLDSSARGIRFDYAFEAAVKRTRHEFNLIASNLPTDELVMFCGG